MSVRAVAPGTPKAVPTGPRGARRVIRVLGYGLIAASLFAGAGGCGGGGSAPVVRPGSTTVAGPTTAPTSTTTPPTSTSTTPATTEAPGAGQQVTITPATGLKATQTVRVVATGFSPGESLVVTECAAKGTATGPGDCNLTGLKAVTSDGAGKVSLDFTVVKGPFGANNIVCSATQACLVSVTQASLSPTQEADAEISFA